MLNATSYLHIFVVYLKPSLILCDFENCLSNIVNCSESFSSLDLVMICGDFNCHVFWEDYDGDLVPTKISSSKDHCLVDSICDMGLKQFCDFVNVSGNQLDLIFCSYDANIVINACQPLLRCDSHHNPVLILLNYTALKTSNNLSCIRRNFLKSNFEELNAFFSSYDWFSKCLTDNPEDLLHSFNDVLAIGINSFVPFHSKAVSKFPPWYNAHLIELALRKSKVHRSYKISLSPADRQKYLNVKKEFHVVNRFRYSNYLLDLEANLARNPKKCWSYCNGKRRSTGFPARMELDNSVATSKVDICNFFADYFESVYIPHSHSSGSYDNLKRCIDMQPIVLSESKVL